MNYKGWTIGFSSEWWKPLPARHEWWQAFRFGVRMRGNSPELLKTMIDLREQDDKIRGINYARYPE